MTRKEPIEWVSKCCGAGTFIIPHEHKGKPLDVTMCRACREPTKTVLKGEEMKPIEGGIYCQLCVKKLNQRVPQDLAIQYPAEHSDGKGTCYGCGETVRLRIANRIIRRK
jgi:hypothetical protein